MKWIPIEEYSILERGERVIITDGTDWLAAYACGNNCFAEKEGDMMVWGAGITHFSRVELPKEFVK